DSEGRVIGVVLGKSASENLNYALPIAQVLGSPHNLARFDTRMRYGLPNTRLTLTRALDLEFELPLSVEEFGRRLIGQMEARNSAMAQELMTINAARLFPRSEGSERLLQAVHSTPFPWLI